jgi:hypothetical protein
MIRITSQHQQNETIVNIDGDMIDTDVPEVRQAQTALTGPVALNLSDLTACSREGVSVLQEWLDSGARLLDATLYLRMVLNSTR